MRHPGTHDLSREADRPETYPRGCAGNQEAQVRLPAARLHTPTQRGDGEAIEVPGAGRACDSGGDDPTSETHA
jgi:hypothetical protein